MVQPNTRIYEEERNEMCPLLPPPQKKITRKRFDEVDSFLSV